MLEKEDLEQIKKAIETAEQNTSGEIRVHIDESCDKDAFERGVEIFHELNMHETQLRNGILIYIDFTHRKFAIVGDKGIHEHVGEEFWISTKDLMLAQFKQQNFLLGVVESVQIVGEKLSAYFSASDSNPDELSNQVTVG
jgi:uncharacterized membrane protein